MLENPFLSGLGIDGIENHIGYYFSIRSKKKDITFFLKDKFKLEDRKFSHSYLRRVQSQKEFIELKEMYSLYFPEENITFKDKVIPYLCIDGITKKEFKEENINHKLFQAYYTDQFKFNFYPIRTKFELDKNIERVIDLYFQYEKNKKESLICEMDQTLKKIDSENEAVFNNNKKRLELILSSTKGFVPNGKMSFEEIKKEVWCVFDTESKEFMTPRRSLSHDSREYFGYEDKSKLFTTQNPGKKYLKVENELFDVDVAKNEKELLRKIHYDFEIENPYIVIAHNAGYDFDEIAKRSLFYFKHKNKNKFKKYIEELKLDVPFEKKTTYNPKEIEFLKLGNPAVKPQIYGTGFNKKVVWPKREVCCTAKLYKIIAFYLKSHNLEHLCKIKKSISYDRMERLNAITDNPNKPKYFRDRAAEIVATYSCGDVKFLKDRIKENNFELFKIVHNIANLYDLPYTDVSYSFSSCFEKFKDREFFLEFGINRKKEAHQVLNKRRRKKKYQLKGKKINNKLEIILKEETQIDIENDQIVVNVAKTPIYTVEKKYQGLYQDVHRIYVPIEKDIAKIQKAYDLNEHIKLIDNSSGIEKFAYLKYLKGFISDIFENYFDFYRKTEKLNEKKERYTKEDLELLIEAEERFSEIYEFDRDFFRHKFGHMLPLIEASWNQHKAYNTFYGEHRIKVEDFEREYYNSFTEKILDLKENFEILKFDPKSGYAFIKGDISKLNENYEFISTQDVLIDGGSIIHYNQDLISGTSIKEKDNSVVLTFISKEKQKIINSLFDRNYKQAKKIGIETVKKMCDNLDNLTNIYYYDRDYNLPFVYTKKNDKNKVLIVDSFDSEGEECNLKQLMTKITWIEEDEKKGKKYRKDFFTKYQDIFNKVYIRKGQKFMITYKKGKNKRDENSYKINWIIEKKNIKINKEKYFRQYFGYKNGKVNLSSGNVTKLLLHYYPIEKLTHFRKKVEGIINNYLNVN